jgi:hypothetical protein
MKIYDDDQEKKKTEHATSTKSPTRCTMNTKTTPHTVRNVVNTVVSSTSHGDATQ